MTLDRETADSGAITEKKELIAAMGKLYSDELKKDLDEILEGDLKSVADLERASSMLLEAHSKVSGFVTFEKTFRHLL